MRLALLAAALLLAWPATAAACAIFKGATPRVGSDSTGPVGEVVLHFSSAVQADGSTITVTDTDTGQVVSHGDPYLQDATHIAVLADAVTPGAYQVRWRVACDCGSDNPGDYKFTIR